MAALPTLWRAIGNRIATTLTSQITDSALSIAVDDATGMDPDGGVVILDRDDVSKREVVYVESIAGNTLTISTGGRGLAGTTAVSHDSGATVNDVAVDENINGLIDTFVEEHNADGTHGTGVIGTANLADEAVTTAKIDDEAVTSAKRSGGYKIGVIPGSTFGSTGNKAITGVGFRPKLVRFTVLNSAGTGGFNPGFGAMDESGNQFTSIFSSNPTRNGLTTRCIGWMTTSSTPAMAASYVSMDSDGFTINVNTPNNAFDVAYEAYG